MGDCTQDGRACVNQYKPITECAGCNCRPGLSNHFKPEPKRIPVECMVLTHSHHNNHQTDDYLHITDKLYRAIKQVYPKGYIEVP